MKREDVIRLAREAGFGSGTWDPTGMPFVRPHGSATCLVELERFAALVETEALKSQQQAINPAVMAEREAIAQWYYRETSAEIAARL